MSNNRGTYIVVEGLDGSGKTTQLQNIHRYLGPAKTLSVREPGGTAMSEEIRRILKDRQLPRSAATNMFLFSAARTDLIDTVIRPTLATGQHVLCDRNWLSTVAYQTAEGADREHIIALSKLATNDLFRPDITILIDTDPAVCSQRLHARGDSEADFFDSKGEAYFVKVRQAYLQEASHSDTIHVIDGNPTPEAVWQQIKALLQAAGL